MGRTRSSVNRTIAGARKAYGTARWRPLNRTSPMRPPVGQPGAERCAAGPTNVPEKEGGSGRGDEVPPCTRKRSQGRRNHGLRPVCELIFPRPQESAPGAKRSAGGAPNIPEKEGGSGRGDEVPPCTRKRSQGPRNHGLRPVCD